MKISIHNIIQILIQWNLDLTNLYITKSLVLRTIFFALAIVKCMKTYLDTTKPRCSEHILPVPVGPSLYRGSTVIAIDYFDFYRSFDLNWQVSEDTFNFLLIR